ncbi:MAG: hypothetical protein IJ386_10075, partial [Clostridia bacterium]|nr:hypothetical protein [Clostridia bacterium]
KNGDTEMLETLRARETPELYSACNFRGYTLDFKKNYDPELICTVAECGSDEILKYFAEEFEITNRSGMSFAFTFPFIGELIDALLLKNNNNAEWMLADAIEHNRRVYEDVSELMESAVRYYKGIYGDNLTSYNVNNSISDGIMRYFDLFGDGSFLDFMTIEGGGRVVSNLIRVNGQSDSIRKNRLIQELNDTYDMIINIKPKI